MNLDVFTRELANDEWIVNVGRYILNMGVIELTTRKIIFTINASEQEHPYNAGLETRICFIRKHFPRKDMARHEWAMNVFDVAIKHCKFRNAIAHSPLMFTDSKDGKKTALGIFDITPKDKVNFGHFISIEELIGRVNESEKLGQNFSEIDRKDFNLTLTK